MLRGSGDGSLRGKGKTKVSASFPVPLPPRTLTSYEGLEEHLEHSGSDERLDKSHRRRSERMDGPVADLEEDEEDEGDEEGEGRSKENGNDSEVDEQRRGARSVQIPLGVFVCLSPTRATASGRDPSTPPLSPPKHRTTVD